MKRLFLWMIIPLVCGLSIWSVRPFFRESKKEEPAVFNPHTWSTFNEYRRLEMLLKGFAIQSIIDIPSIDILELQKHDLGVKRYLGVADSSLMAQGLQAQFGNGYREFVHFRIDADILPRADLILCWDKLCSLSNEEVRASLVQLKKSGAKFLLMHHYPETKINMDTISGVFRPVNWNNPPFNFPEPIIHIMEERENGVVSLALWSLDKL